MFEDAFEKLEQAEITEILEKTNPSFEGTIFDPAQTTIMAQDLSFYPGYRFLDIADYTVMPEIRRYVIYSADKFEVLDFTSDPIDVLNEYIPITLNEGNIDLYLKFFFTYVRGVHGRFLIVENVDDIDWKEEPPPAARKAIGEMLNPVTLKNISKDGTYQLEACVIFKNALFDSRIEITKSGEITIKDQDILIEDMPIMDDTFGQ